MLRYLAGYGASALVFLVLDGLWLGVLARKTYEVEFGALLRQQPNMIAAVLFYAIYLVGVQVFAVLPAAGHGSWTRALILGVVLGLVAYATYDLTNLATLNGFSLKVVMIDLPWGMFVTGCAAVAGY
ncbi:MAG: hypothetical protein JWM33_1969, partial [Caulobacteraceae bacterium]|nr:hypothetical protein [Caulobacteraceae bacterium]